ncbi:MAG: sulfotransferase domain-containing protein [Brevefilum sp.]|nr:sulfotransferase domain-containing protein [Brevefilum sp.]
MNVIEIIIQYFSIKSSGYFDKNFYINAIPKADGLKHFPLMHFITKGWQQNLNPGPDFDTSWYLKTYPDVKESKVNPLFHYLRYGKKEGRQIKKPYASRATTPRIIGGNTVDFMIIGAQRAGTTSLYKFLDILPSFCGSYDKEVGYFSIDELYTKGMDWYHQQFRTCARCQLKFEATPEYLYYPFVPGRIKQYKSDLKFIVLLRDPVDRCFSAWKLFKNIHKHDQVNRQRIIVDSKNTKNDALANLMTEEDFPHFSTLVKEDLDRYYTNSVSFEPSFVRRGLYHQQISHWMKFFDISQFLFLEISELNQPEELLMKLQDFLAVNLDLEVRDLTMPEYNKLSGKKTVEVDPETLKLLQNFYHQHNLNLFQLINKTYDWRLSNQPSD